MGCIIIHKKIINKYTAREEVSNINSDSIEISETSLKPLSLIKLYNNSPSNQTYNIPGHITQFHKTDECGNPTPLNLDNELKNRSFYYNQKELKQNIQDNIKNIFYREYIKQNSNIKKIH